MATITRVNSSRAASGTSYTLNFTEGTALPAGYVLIAVVNVSSATALTTPTGWTAITGGGNDGANQTRAYWRASNGTINGITFPSFPNADRTGYIMATPGTGSTANGAGGAVPSGTSIPFASISVAMSPGIIIRSGGLATAPTNWTTGWSGSTSVMTPPASGRLSVSQADYTGDPTVATTLTWTGARTAYAFEFVVSIAAATPPVPTGFSVTGGAKKFSINPGTSSGASFYRTRRRRTGLTPPAGGTQVGAPYPLAVMSDGVTGGNFVYTYDGTGVVAGIWDTGFLATHNEFTGRVQTGWSIVPGEAWNTDNINHGTGVGSLLGGTNNGVAKAVTLLPTKVLPDAALPGAMPDMSLFPQLCTDFVTALAGRPGVVNMSFTTPNTGDAGYANFATGMATLRAARVFVTIAIGNTNTDLSSVTLGAAYNGVLLVGGTTSTNTFWVTTPGSSGSSYATWMKIQAPAAVITTASSDSNSATQTQTGTSFAAPLVAGIGALIKQANPELHPDRWVEIMTSQAWQVITGNPNGLAALANAQSNTTDWFIRTGLSTGAQDDDGYGDAEPYEYQFSASSDGTNWSAWSSSASATTNPLNYNITATRTGIGAISAAAGVGFGIAATRTGVGAIAASAVAGRASSAALAGVGALSGAAVVGKAATCVLAGTGSIVAAMALGKAMDASLVGTGAISAAAIISSPAYSIAATLPGAGALTADAIVGKVPDAALAGTGAVAASAAVGVSASASLTGVGTITAGAVVGKVADASLVGLGQVTTTIVSSAGPSAVLAGIGVIDATLELGTSIGASLAGSGTIAASASVARSAGATLTGTGTIVAGMALGKTAGAALAGVGAIAATASALAPGGEVQAELVGAAHIVAVMVRTGDLPVPDETTYPHMAYPDLVMDDQPPRYIGFHGRSPNLRLIEPPDLTL